jgi:tripartite-type tricarboxylate transporter receptor subunit TctC
MKAMNKREMLRLLATGLAAAPATGWLRTAGAEARFPDKPIKLIVAFAPGTGSDVLARIVAASMGPLLGQAIITDNRSGVGGVMGTEQGARAPADGYTLTLATTSTLLTNPALNPKVRYRADKDFAPVAGLARTSFVLVTAETPEAPHSVAELRQRLGQGNGSFGSAGVGTITHLAAEVFLKQAGLKAVHVPYRGSSAALTDVASGQLLFGCDSMAAALPLIRAGRLRALAVSSPQRLSALPGVPTAAEAGMPKWQLSAWWGLVAPAATPPAAIAVLSDAALKALELPAVKAQLTSQQLEAMPLPAAGFGALIRNEQPFWSDFVRQTGIQIEF